MWHKARSMRHSVDAYWPLIELSIRDFWDRMFQLCKQSEYRKTNDVHEPEEHLGVMKLYIHRYPRKSDGHSRVSSQSGSQMSGKCLGGGGGPGVPGWKHLKIKSQCGLSKDQYRAVLHLYVFLSMSLSLSYLQPISDLLRNKERLKFL